MSQMLYTSTGPIGPNNLLNKVQIEKIFSLHGKLADYNGERSPGRKLPPEELPLDIPGVVNRRTLLKTVLDNLEKHGGFDPALERDLSAVRIPLNLIPANVLSSLKEEYGDISVKKGIKKVNGNEYLYLRFDGDHRRMHRRIYEGKLIDANGNFIEDTDLTAWYDLREVDSKEDANFYFVEIQKNLTKKISNEEHRVTFYWAGDKESEELAAIMKHIGVRMTNGQSEYDIGSPFSTDPIINDSTLNILIKILGKDKDGLSAIKEVIDLFKEAASTASKKGFVWDTVGKHFAEGVAIIRKYRPDLFTKPTPYKELKDYICSVADSKPKLNKFINQFKIDGGNNHNAEAECTAYGILLGFSDQTTNNYIKGKILIKEFAKLMGTRNESFTG